MNIFVLLIVILLAFAFIGASGVGMWQHNYGWYPSGGLMTILVIVLIVWLLTRG